MNKSTRQLLPIEARLLLILAVIYINHESAIPGIADYGITIKDKVEHFEAFYVLSFLLDFSFPLKPFNLWKIIVLLAYGAGIELFQLTVIFRDCSLLDFMADVLGMIVYWLSLPWLKRLPFLRDRWSVEP